MAQSRSTWNRSDIDLTVDEVVDVLEEALELVPDEFGAAKNGGVILHTIPQVNELRELLRTTAERMEFEAAQLRWQLELLETSTRPAWYH